MMEINDDEAVPRPFLIVTGSSAGGIEPLRAFIASVPPHFPAPIVVAQHLPQQQASHLVEILEKRSRIPVRAITERVDLVPGTVYVAPPNVDIEIIDDAANVVAVTRAGPKPSIDVLFASAAQTHGDRCVAIIFSGLGQDGLAGARAVKEYGGTVVVQEPSSAQYPSMPSAIPPTMLDLVARPESMGALLAELLEDARIPESPMEQGALRSLLVQVRDRTGIDFTQYKTPTIMRRLARLMVGQGMSSIGDYARYLQTHPEAHQRVAGAFLIKVTEFFRDAALFEELRMTVLPQLMEHARQGGSELRIWSAGTSTGEEAYSIAILCAELLRTVDHELAVRIFATDLDDEAIAFARRGVYPPPALRHLPQSWLERYFVRVGDVYEVSKRIRNMTVFGQHDLGQRAPFPRIDLVLCRNVLIYFTKELQTRALQLFAFSLREGGFLVLGKAESTGTLSEYFRTVHGALKLYQRQGDRILIPPTRIRDGGAVTQTDPRVAGGAKNVYAGNGSGAPPREPRSTGNEAFGAFLSNSAIGVITLDRRYDIVALNGAARAMFEIHGVGVGEDLIHLSSAADGAALRDIVDAALRNEAQPPRELAINGTSGEPLRWLEVTCVSDRSGGSVRSGLVALFAIDVTQRVRTRDELDRRTRELAAARSELSARVDDLSKRQRALLQANDELTAANNELRGVNEQLLISVEESASSNEEIETLNEEMQATNEELETLNEELQATVEELNTTNDELEVRGAELERAGESREELLRAFKRERDALRSVLGLDGASFAIVDGEGTVASEGAAAEALGGRPAADLVDGAVVHVDGRSYRVEVRGEEAKARLVIVHPRV